MHVIWGNGINDATLPGRAASAAPAWQPNAPRTLAWARADGTGIVQDAYTGLVLWRHKGGPVRRLRWSADAGGLLIGATRHDAISTLSGGVKPLRLAPHETLAAAE